ncbi:MAG: hypothetical protein WAK55_03405 [Xanthobacteraceae bacterium]
MAWAEEQINEPQKAAMIASFFTCGFPIVSLCRCGTLPLVGDQPVPGSVITPE